MSIEIHREFDSWFEFVSSVNDDSLYTWKRYHRSHQQERYDDWRGTRTWDKAINMAIYTGWPEGRELLYDAIQVARPKPEPFKSIELSAAGGWPLVAAYCAGSPECMVIDPGSDLRHSKPIVRIDYHAAYHSGIDSQAVMLRGAAVVSLIETLERKGYSTEVRLINKVNMRQGSLTYSIVFKKAGESLDVDRAAFAMAHPATHRRLAFALYEQYPVLEESTYGKNEAPKVSDASRADTIFIEGLKWGRETPTTAREAVEKAAAKVLGEILESEE